MSSAANRQESLQAVVDAAREWRRVYWAWLQRPLEGRHMDKNGENLALSGLLDALQALDDEEAKSWRNYARLLEYVGDLDARSSAAPTDNTEGERRLRSV